MNKRLKQLWSYVEDFNKKHIGVLAAGVAFFTSLAFFPALAAGVALSTFVIGADKLEAAVTALYAYLPVDIAAMLSAQLQMETGNHTGNVMIAGIGIAIAVFSASSAASNMITALNVAYGVEETRNFIKVKLLSMALTLGAIVSGGISLALLVIREDLLLGFGIPHSIVATLPIVRWVVIVSIVCLSLEVLYRYGINRKKRQSFRFLTLGTGIATLAWLSATVLFFLYAQYFAGFSRSYSVFAGIVVLMIWLNLSTLAVLIGAMVNARHGR